MASALYRAVRGLVVEGEGIRLDKPLGRGEILSLPFHSRATTLAVRAALQRSLIWITISRVAKHLR